MKNYSHFIVSFLSFGIPFSLFQTEAAEVNVEQYQKANPDPLDAIPENLTIQSKKKIGSGAWGTVYSITTPDVPGEFIQKEGDTDNEADIEQYIRVIDNEADIGQCIRDIRKNITSKTQIADIQGLELVVPGKKLADESLIQERVQGETFRDYSRKKDWVDTPKKALERLCALMSSLYALEKAGIAHNDLHASNIMMEKKRLPDEVIAANNEAMIAKVEAKARQMTKITKEEEDLAEEGRRALNEARTTAKANLPLEDQYKYIPRIIDFGLSKKINEEDFQKLSSRNMKSLGILIPSFLFGINGANILSINNHVDIYNTQESHKKAAREELIQAKKNSGQQQDLSALAIMSLEEDLTKLSEEIDRQGMRIRSPYYLIQNKNQTKEGLQQRFDELQRQFTVIERQIAIQSQTYEQEYGEDIQKYKTRFEAELQVEIDARISQLIMEKFHKANNAMKVAIGKSYPKVILEELAQIMANCLSVDPTQHPTVAKVFEKVTDLTLSDWDSGNYIIQPGIIQREPNETALESDSIQAGPQEQSPDVNERTQPPPLPTPKLIMPEGDLEDWYD
ncbi:MAG: hypothetical protein LBB05_03110 [Puniceicoccales bacterium]|jgi:serine/threonine protein kinase|nr:hypothetical protein [Puniceicoccales bacterium]